MRPASASHPIRQARLRLGAALRAATGELERALYPSLCWLCRSRAAVDGFGCVEHALEGALAEAEAPVRCRGCARLLPAGLPSGFCAVCRRGPRGYRRLVAAGDYGHPALRAWILALKHGQRRDLARPLAAFLAAAWRRAGGPEPGALLTGVPLHPLRRLERGHDQAGLLAAELGVLLGLRCGRFLRRRRWTWPQGAASAPSRSANVEGAFAPRSRALWRIAGRPVWLVDDVFTSGATARACAAALRRAGAGAVSVLVLARVAPPEERDACGPGSPPRPWRDGGGEALDSTG